MKYKRKLRNFLLMPKIQMRYIYYLMAINIAPMAALVAYGGIQLRRLQFEAASFDNLPDSLITTIDSTVFNLSLAYVTCFLLVIVMIFYGAIVVSHRFVGPMYVINRYIEAMKSGDFKMERELRKDDEMKETLALLKELGAQLSDKK